MSGVVAGRAGELIRSLGLAPHPEGGHYREVFRSGRGVAPEDGRGRRSALTTIDFLLVAGEYSAWHRVRSDEAWHLLEGGGLRLWLMPPDLASLEAIELGPASIGKALHNVAGDTVYFVEHTSQFHEGDGLIDLIL